MVNRVWYWISPYWHIITTMVGFTVFAVLWFGKVDAYDGRIIDNATDIQTLKGAQAEQKVISTRMDYNIQIIARKIGVVPLKKGDDE